MQNRMSLVSRIPRCLFRFSSVILTRNRDIYESPDKALISCGGLHSEFSYSKLVKLRQTNVWKNRSFLVEKRQVSLFSSEIRNSERSLNPLQQSSYPHQHRIT